MLQACASAVDSCISQDLLELADNRSNFHLNRRFAVNVRSQPRQFRRKQHHFPDCHRFPSRSFPEVLQHFSKGVPSIRARTGSGEERPRRKPKQRICPPRSLPGFKDRRSRGIPVADICRTLSPIQATTIGIPAWSRVESAKSAVQRCIDEVLHA